MKIYVASSWKNQHAVEMLTSFLRSDGHDVLSFIENDFGEEVGSQNPMGFEDWIKTESADKSFKYDTDGATKSDLVIYIGPSGKDAAAEVGAAWASGIEILGLYAKGEDFGLMRKMIMWFDRWPDLIEYIQGLQKAQQS
jgi:hypothetical protein